MKAVVGVDGSKYSEWAVGWLAKMPFRAAPRVMAVHGVDEHSLRAPFIVHPSVSGNEPDQGEEIHRLQSQAKQVVEDTKRRMTDFGLAGSVRVEKEPIARALQEIQPLCSFVKVLGSYASANHTVR